MVNRDTFSSYHPLVNFLYFGLVLAFSVVFVHPVCLVISLICALTYAIYLNGKKAVRFNLLFMLPVFVTTSLMNPAFNHEGGTILVYLRSGNPLTLESIVYGMVAATMIIAVISWFSCYNAVMTSDKFVYLFGRVIPALSLILSMVLRFVPRFKAQFQVVSQAQQCIGRDVSQGGVLQRVKKALTILSIMVTWSLENAIETADSMKSRGYGLEGRTAFSIYRMDKRDRRALLFLGLCGIYITAGAVTGGLYYRYFPTIKGVEMGLYSLSLFFFYTALCLMPMVLNLAADRKWQVVEAGKNVRKEGSQIGSML